MASSADDLLRKHPFLEGVARKHVDALCEHAQNVHFETGQSLFREGEAANGFYLIQSGQIALETHLRDTGNVLVQTIGDEDVLGWSWLFPGSRWQFDARAIESTDAVWIDGEFLRRYCEENPEFGYEFFKRITRIITQRLQGTRRQLTQLYSAR